ncbi:hypothetical protein TL5118_04058 [Thalassovita autumnalis]|uniref:Ribbon-helix-helix protein CopG domain-containing protein n=1 Tax=Thalassovita autumnalis TaxID=2072972 RepID=A0A0P1G9H0_9RHOB|nr:hypothetical protein TL5118_04058 [Thalassovita autumnalis]CUH70757.1 hypothetical protein TL5120_00537 [Thalassovita autumnalis]
MVKIKTYRPVNLNMDSELLMKLDQHKHSGKPRSQLIHEAIEHYLVVLDRNASRQRQWSV